MIGGDRRFGQLRERHLVGEQLQQIRFGQPAARLRDAVEPGGQHLGPAARQGFHARALRRMQAGAALVDRDLDQDPGQPGDQRQRDQAG